MTAKRIHNEKKVVATMIEIYCRGRHRTHNQLCVECTDLLGYALQRLERCQFGEDKPFCVKCTVHCYM